MATANKKAQQLGRPLRVMFQDEARFGRINNPRRCWAPKGVRPSVCKQIIREYTYLYGAVCPTDGHSDYLILPAMNAATMDLFLLEIADRYPDDFILMIYDGAPCHSQSALTIPDTMMVHTLPPYSPQLNPVENLWDQIREKFFPNTLFDSLAALEDRLVQAVQALEADTHFIRSLSSWDWIIQGILI